MLGRELGIKIETCRDLSCPVCNFRRKGNAGQVAGPSCFWNFMGICQRHKHKLSSFSPWGQGEHYGGVLIGSNPINDPLGSPNQHWSFTRGEKIGMRVTDCTRVTGCNCLH